NFNAEPFAAGQAAGKVFLAVLLIAGWCHAADTEPATLPAPRPYGNVVKSGLDEDGGVTILVGKTRVITARTKIPVVVDTTRPDVAVTTGVTPNSIAISGLKPGTAQLVVTDEQGRSQIVDVTVLGDKQGLMGTMKRLFPDATIDASVVDGQVVLRGH